MSKKKGYLKMLNNMRDMSDMEEDEQDTVKVTCLTGIAIGFVVALCPTTLCAALIIYAVVTQ